MDLRERAVARVLAGESVRSVASMLSISAATVVRWSGRRRAAGNVASGRIGGYKVGILSGGHRDWLLARTTRDFTLRGLVAELAERGVKVDYVQVWRFVHAEGLSFKNKRAARRTTAAVDRAAARPVDEVSGQAGTIRISVCGWHNG